jgi:hypothetical protein
MLIIILVIAILCFVIYKAWNSPSYKFWRMMQDEDNISFRYFSDSPNWMVMDRDMGKIEGWHGPYVFNHSNVTFHCYCLGPMAHNYLDDYIKYKQAHN